MLKKRLIYSLIYADGNYMLSRNFRLQKAGDINWLLESYDFSKISFCIDELIIIDASRKKKGEKKFFNDLNILASNCFVPIAAGGGIIKAEQAKIFFSNGSDKIILNSIIHEGKNIIEEISKNYGSQSIIASVDFKKIDGVYRVFINNGSFMINENFEDYIKKISCCPIGEIYLNSIDKDGTGQGLNFEILDFLPKNLKIPLILCGGVGKEIHLVEGLKNKKISAVSTANLFNFIGDGLQLARQKVISSKIDVPDWKFTEAIKFKNIV